MWLQTVTANVEYVRKNVGLATNKMSIDGTCYFFLQKCLLQRNKNDTIWIFDESARIYILL